jgi:hypothetical protein
MTIRIGSSCALSPAMAIGNVVETRKFISSQSGWKEVAQQAIKNKQYLIVTPCINRNDGSGHIPAIKEWQDFIDSTCSYLKSIGANRNNTRLSIINEPMKYCTKEQYSYLINLAYPIIKSYGFLVGAGNEEFLTAQAKGNMYQYILANCEFDILDIHIQGSCDNKEKTDYWTNTARSWTTKPIDCTEAFYGTLPQDYPLLVYQMESAERIGCENFCNVFNNLDQSAFPFNTDSWKRLAFKVNGMLRLEVENKFALWNIEMITRAPQPNIKEGIKDGMIIKTIGYKTTDVHSGYGVELLHELLLLKKYIEDIENMYVYDSETRKAVESFQTDLGITVDGRVGRQTWRKFINSIDDSTNRKKFQFNFEVVMSPYNLDGDT